MTEYFGREGDDSASSHSPGRRLRSLLQVPSVAGQVFVLQLALAVLLVVAAVVALVLQAEGASMQEARQRSPAGAAAFAHAPGTLTAMQSRDPSALLQPGAEAARKAAGVDHSVAFRPTGIRWTHPGTRLIGKHVVGAGTYPPSLHGTPRTATFTSSVGPAVDTTVPVSAPDGSTAGFVAAGIRVQRAGERVAQPLALVLGAAAGGLLVVAVGAAWTSRRLRRQTHGLRPAELRRRYEHHDAVLHAVREGVLVISGDGRLLLANDEARRLLALPADAERRPLADLDLEPGLSALLASGREATDEVLPAGDRLIAVNVRPTAPHGGPAGTVVTLRDTTELRTLAGRAGVAQERLKLIYDAGLRIGTTLEVGRTAEELADVAVPRFADVATVELLEPVLRGDEPAAGPGTGLRRLAVSGVPQAAAIYRVGEDLRFAPGTPMATALASGRPVLVDDLPRSDEWRRPDPEHTQRVLDAGIRSLIAVPLQARGVVLGLANFWRTGSAGGFEEEDLAFAEELAARAAVAIDNARRYTREHTTAVTLQRSLLPQTLPEQSALEAAHRYLPALAGVGGDWFDVIPLPGARVALVVGDVVGHGLHAAATMGRLRTAVHNFSALDLPPDELLNHLDELVTHIDTDEAGTAEAGAGGDEGTWPGGTADGAPAQLGRTGITGATCLYAIYDPVGGLTTLARAGHPGPAVIAPDGTVSFPEVPVSPPLGLGGGEPVETTELTLGEGSRLVLYTDGLIEGPDRDLGRGLELLRTALAGAADRAPEQICTAVLDTLLPEHPSDDIALLVARTRLLAPGRVAEWDVPSDPAAVARIRSACLRTLESWGLVALSFTTELILSELITNAIRYGAQPIRVRLLHDRALICEVSDGTSASPHLRRAATTDEGGRGLFLVAQFAQRWGTRYTPNGKVIWTEQTLDGGRPEPGPDSADDILDQWDDVPAL
ncbi:SpoIIE family protein phosphatase [Streptomyces angustmyceticus]|uniref:Histidine kinase n=1 Tax=Streptomyces angustmyceticus TaxID=285578 RepID=A0A5J4L2U2_9ACTN|nr:SpoIIE family protein phosphatase/ATP-binding protein [Streptomyces angustmyceticus]UAL66487.1 SpoIIE family protein phosphatase [Streptomyces angustmyceticus]GES28687.1 histidine kinase [Streptomyces angustmyceticus]